MLTVLLGCFVVGDLLTEYLIVFGLLGLCLWFGRFTVIGFVRLRLLCFVAGFVFCVCLVGCVCG